MFLHSTAASLVVVCTATACSPGPMPVSQSPRDPSNPAAAEGTVPSSAAASSASAATEGSQGSHSPPVQGSHGTHQHDHSSHRKSDSIGGAQAVETADAGISAAYVCPMHPEVTSSVPGRCPKCGMNLVPKK